MIDIIIVSGIIVFACIMSFREGARFGADTCMKRLVEEKYVLYETLENGDISFIKPRRWFDEDDDS